MVLCLIPDLRSSPMFVKLSCVCSFEKLLYSKKGLRNAVGLAHNRALTEGMHELGFVERRYHTTQFLQFLIYYTTHFPSMIVFYSSLDGFKSCASLTYVN